MSSHQLEHPRDDVPEGRPDAPVPPAAAARVPQQAGPPDGEVGPAWTRARGVGVGWDGSPSSAEAVRWAAAEAAARSCPLTVLHAAGAYAVWLDPTAHPDLPALVREMSSSGAQAALDALEELRAVAAPGATAVEVGRTTGLLGPQDLLLECSEELDALVLGNRGRARLTAALLGSVSFSVAARSACPVVVVRDGDVPRPGPGVPVVVGYDASGPALAAARFAAAQAARAGAELEVVPVLQPGDGRGGELRESAAALVWRLRAEHPGLSASVLAQRGAPDRVLLAAGEAAGLVVVGSRGRTRTGALVLGSTSTAVVHGSRTPVAVVRGTREG
ncbi:universal stress protein [Quadrisphaera oryzae]|uniref:universal stress protein n=1 Tax=Quadrisphaera TaxID=317661 RepID=UPI001646FDAE|nr:universal stress protein [Quadrisphaera sp. RL12-1S]